MRIRRREKDDKINVLNVIRVTTISDEIRSMIFEELIILRLKNKKKEEKGERMNKLNKTRIYDFK